MKRHPKVCKYFLTQDSCKFGKQCSYKHEVHSNQNEILELMEEIAVLEGCFELLNNKGISEEKKKIYHKCSHCAYEASTGAVIKRQIQ